MRSPYVERNVAPVAPVAYPRPAAIASARSYLHDRDGYTAFAVIDSDGRMRGSHLHRTFVSASVVKAMLLVAYLREAAGAHRRLDEEDRELLQPMIHYSDNEAASAVWERVGNPRLRALARRAGMTDFSIEASPPSAVRAAGGSTSRAAGGGPRAANSSTRSPGCASRTSGWRSR